MRIVWAASYGGRHRGSFVPALEHVARAVIARGDRFDLVVSDVPGAAWHDEVRALGAGLHVASGARDAARRVAALRPALVHAHFHDWLVPLTLAIWRSRARLLWHLHSTFEPGGRALRVTPARTVKYRLVGARVERFVCVSETIAAELRTLGAPARRIAVLPNAVDTAHFRPPSLSERSAARARLGVPDSPVVAFFGRDPQLKGADVLREALARRPGITVLSVGTPEHAVAALREHAAVVALAFTEDVRTVLWASDALALPSRGEGMPLVALEARAAGLPVVASDLPWARELQRDDPGITTGAREPSAFAAALDEALRGGGPGPAGGRDLAAWSNAVLRLYDARHVGRGR